jgi:hypothetical protein
MKNAVFWGVAPCRSARRHIPQDGILQFNLYFSLLFFYYYYYFTAIGCSPGGGRSNTYTNKERLYIKGTIQNKVHTINKVHTLRVIWEYWYFLPLRLSKMSWLIVPNQELSKCIWKLIMHIEKHERRKSLIRGTTQFKNMTVFITLRAVA